MNMLKKRLVMALTLALCVMPISAPLALAETNTSVESVETTSDVETTDESQPAADTDVTTDPDVATDTDASTDPDATNDTDVTEETEETDAGEVPDSSQNTEDDLPPVLDENGDVVDPGTLPDSPFYWLTTLIEKLQVILTFDPVEKTELLEEQALERIAEAGALIEEGDTELAEGALKGYTEKIAEAQAFVALLTETETVEKLETALSKTHANNVQTLGGLLDKLPPQAAQRVAVNIVRSMEKSIAKMEKKDQQRVAKELKKATEELEESELTEEEQAALESLDQVLDSEEGDLEEEVMAATSGAALKTMALTTNTLTQKTADTGKENRRSAVTKSKSEAQPKLEANVEPAKQQEQKAEGKTEQNESKGTSKDKPNDVSMEKPQDKTIDEAKAVDEHKNPEQKPQEGQADHLKAEQESALNEKERSSSSPEKKETQKTQSKTSNDSGKGDKSGGKQR